MLTIFQVYFKKRQLRIHNFVTTTLYKVEQYLFENFTKKAGNFLTKEVCILSSLATICKNDFQFKLRAPLWHRGEAVLRNACANKRSSKNKFYQLGHVTKNTGDRTNYMNKTAG